MALRYSKHHGLSNDFLIQFADSLPANAADQAVALCDRRTGLGADGLIVGVVGHGREISMHLYNSDGSSAAVSGNGLRCLAQAAARRHGVAALELDVTTGAGIRHCSVRPTDEPRVAIVTVEMGTVRAGPTPDVADLIAAVTTELVAAGTAELAAAGTAELGGASEAGIGVQRFETCDIGNPHVVCEVADPEEIAVEVVGPAIESHFAHGANVSFVAVSGPDRLKLRVWERGAGATSACGTGATVAAHVFHRWGLIGPRSTVLMPGGEAAVDLTGPITLTGLATHVADIEVSDG